MKLNIIFTEENSIGNYQNVLLSSKTYKQELQEMPKKSCEHIIITDAINRVEQDEALEIITTCATLLRSGGEITISMVDFESFCSGYCSGDIDEQTTNGIVLNTKSILEYFSVMGIFKQNGITITSSKTNNLLYVIDGAKDAV